MLVIVNDDFVIQTTQKTQRFENMHLSDVASQTWPPKGLEPQKAGTTTKEFRENQTMKGLVPTSTVPTVVKTTSKKQISTY